MEGISSNLNIDNFDGVDNGKDSFSNSLIHEKKEISKTNVINESRTESSSL